MFSQADADNLRIRHTAPGSVHGIGSTVRIVSCDDKNRHGVQQGLGSEIVAHKSFLHNVFFYYISPGQKGNKKAPHRDAVEQLKPSHFSLRKYPYNVK
jgi:hypothetical protein